MAQDPYYDSEQYRKDGGDGTGHWVYEKVTSFFSLVLVNGHSSLTDNRDFKIKTKATFMFIICLRQYEWFLLLRFVVHVLCLQEKQAKD